MAHNGKVTAHCTVGVFLFLIHLAGCHKITLQSVQEMNSVVLEQLSHQFCATSQYVCLSACVLQGLTTQSTDTYETIRLDKKPIA